MTMLIVERYTAESQIHFYRAVMVLIHVVLVLLTATQIGAENHGTDLSIDKEIRIATLQDLYPSNHRHDARMAIELIMQKTIVKKSYPYSIKMHFIDPTADVVDILKNGQFHFVTLSGIEYFNYRNTLHLDPILIPTKTDQPTEIMVFLINKKQTLAAIEKKQDRTLLIESGRRGDLSKLWIDTMLTKRGLPESEHFFTQLRRVNKPGRAVLPVFFGQADACIVTQNAVNVLNELNPQIGRQLKTLFQSKGLVRMMICATHLPNNDEIQAFIKESVNIEHDADTRQAMTIIQMKRFLPVGSQDLAATEKLVGQDQHRAMK